MKARGQEGIMVLNEGKRVVREVMNWRICYCLC
jgi:hypothetical protein